MEADNDSLKTFKKYTNKGGIFSYRLKNKQEMQRREVECEIDEIIEERSHLTQQKVSLIKD